MKWLLDIIAAVLKIFANKTDPEMVKRKDAAKTEARVKEAKDAIRAGDEDKVNAILKDLLWVPVAACCLFSTLGTGCATPAPAPIYVPGNHRVLKIEHDGVAGWFVPDYVFEKLVESMTKQNKEK